LGGEATDWLDRTVRMPRLHSFTLEQWIEQYRVLTEKNRALLKSGLNEKQLAERATNKLEAERPHTAADRVRTASADARPPRSRSRDRKKRSLR